MKRQITFLLFILIASLSFKGLGEEWDFSEDDPSSDDCFYNPLMRDLMIVDYWNRCMCDRYPTYYDHLLEGGYFQMPSALTGNEGEIALGYSSVPPYRNYNIRLQLADFLEITGNYRIFKGVDDPILSPLGFGDFSDKGANIKLVLFRPEYSEYKLPGLAIGMQDFMGTRSFKSKYIVATQVFKPINMEFSIGYGVQRIRRWFGGISWVPFHNQHWLIKGLALTAEYDATPYNNPEREPHPKGRHRKSYINYGFKYRLLDFFDFSLAYVRGMNLAMSGSVFYNFGYTSGLIPKIKDKLPYKAPWNTEPIGCSRTCDVLACELVTAFEEQGFDIYEIRLGTDPRYGKSMYIRLENNKWRLESVVRERLNYLLAYLVPSNIDYVFVVVETDGIGAQEYHFPMQYVRLWRDMQMCSYELKILSPLKDVTKYSPCENALIFKQRRELINLELLPKTNTFFGSSKGKFKYALGLRLNVNGFLWKDIFYQVSFGWNILSNLNGLTGIDRLNPSQIINVRTDIVRYYQKRGITIDQAYVQKGWDMAPGLFSRVAFGYFEPEYGGGAVEILYFPVHKPFAIGVDGAIVKKRTVGGLGFTNKIRKMKGFVITHQHFLGSQYFLDLYYNWQAIRLEFKIKAGKFLANDWGARFEVIRYFPSGLELSFWYTRTNAKDIINGERYYDKGIAISMPLDIFYTHTERSRWSYGMAAWLRDVGQTCKTGKELYQIISELRQTPCGQIK